MLYAQVVVGIPVEGPFDYIVPPHLEEKIKAGSRVLISFGPKKLVGYVVRLSPATSVNKIKTIIELLDEYPLLDEGLLELTRELALYYSCSWGEAIETALPEVLRKGKRFTKAALPIRPVDGPGQKENEILILHDLDGRARWEFYSQEIKKALDNKRPALAIFPDISDLLKAKEMIVSKLGIEPAILYRKQPGELEEWLKVKVGRAPLVFGVRSAIFAPLNEPGLIIIDEEENSVYKQDQVPHYNARHIGILRSALCGAKLILGSTSPSLEAFYLVREQKAGYIQLPKKGSYPEVKLIDSRHLPYSDRKAKTVLPRLLSDAIFSALTKKGKTLLFLNRKGFATFAFCQTCQAALKCPRCSVNLVFDFEKKKLSCHYCNFNMDSPDICPSCNSGYIKYSGMGTQKLESEVARVFPAARIKMIEKEEDLDLSGADIFVSTSYIIKKRGLDFDLIGVLNIDNSLNRVDLRSSERVFSLLAALTCLTEKEIIIPTSFPSHHIFTALLKKDPGFFYDEELKERRQLKFPPYRHMALVKLRAKSEEKVEKAAKSLFENMSQAAKPHGAEVLAVNPAQPAKLRGNYCWQILIRSTHPEKISNFLKISLRNFLHSGIIITVDVDPF